MTKVLYIAGWGRSGTTLLDNLLGQVEGFVSTGELRNLWLRGLIQGRSCGCGLPLVECPFWTHVFSAAFGGFDRVEPARVVDAQQHVRTRHARRMLASARRGDLLEQVEYSGYLHSLYDGIATAPGTRVIVDSSKQPTDAIIAAGLPGVEVYVIHAVRDPRAVAFSWQRVKQTPDKSADAGRLRRVGLVRSTVVWQYYNWVIRHYVRRAVGQQRFRELRYEQLASDPQAALESIIDWLGESPRVRPTFVDNVVDISPSHTASGNPNRFDSGRRRIRLDQEWMRAMPPRRKLVVSLLASPMLWRMRYPFKT